jgi:hypothetical protein
MKPAAPLPQPGDSSSPAMGAVDDATTGLPGLRTWTGVYLFVLGVFVVWVMLLTALTLMFS